MKNLPAELFARTIGCRSDFEIGPFLGDIEIHGYAGLTALKAGASDADSKAHRYELISSVRGGKHVELAVSAQTFRQVKGKPNTRYLKLGGDHAELVKTFSNQPFLVDHNTHEQSARKGTILSARVGDGVGNPFEMAFSVVKPDAVISVLDGTLDRFSIGWFPRGAVLCTAHQVDVRGRDSCGCWPGEVVTVDGKEKIVEYEFSSWAGKELSGVNIPAVQNGTHINDIRAALAAELDITPRRKRKENPMKWKRLRAALGLTADTEELSDEQFDERAGAAAEKLLADRNAALAAGKGIQIDVLIAQAYKDGKLKAAKDEDGKPIQSKRELRLRKVGERDGINALKDEIAELERIVPIGDPPVQRATPAPAKTDLGAGSDSDENPYISVVAQDLGLTAEEVTAYTKQYEIREEV